MVIATSPQTPPLTKAGPPGPRRAELIQWQGRLPERLAMFLESLSPWDLEQAFGAVGRFAEVRELVNIARQVHQVLERGPHTAASGRWSFEEFMETKVEIAELVRSLHRRVNTAAEDACLNFPTPTIRKETPHAPVHQAKAA